MAIQKKFTLDKDLFEGFVDARDCLIATNAAKAAEKDLCRNCLLQFEENKCKENVRRNNWFIIYKEV